jgi:hypothetical protein
MALAKKHQPNDFADLPIIDVGKNLRTIVDPEDYHRIRRFRWFAKRSNYGIYVVRRVRRGSTEKLIRLHRQILAAPTGYDVHHINGNTLDNRKTNLIIVSRKHHHALHSSPLHQAATTQPKEIP